MKRQNFSRKRFAILEAIQNTTTHPTAEWIYQAGKPEYPDLSLGTVYRNLAKFKEEGVIVSVGVVNGQERFDADTNPHNHFICTECGSILDLKERYLPSSLHQMLSEKYGVQVNSHELTFYGVCQDCLLQQSSEPDLAGA